MMRSKALSRKRVSGRLPQQCYPLDGALSLLLWVAPDNLAEKDAALNAVCVYGCLMGAGGDLDGWDRIISDQIISDQEPAMGARVGGRLPVLLRKSEDGAAAKHPFLYAIRDREAVLWRKCCAPSVIKARL